METQPRAPTLDVIQRIIMLIAVFVLSPIALVHDLCGERLPPITPAFPKAGPEPTGLGAPPEDFVCRQDAKKWPAGVKDSRALARGCTIDRIASENCAAYLKVEAAEMCSKKLQAGHKQLCADYPHEDLRELGDAIIRKFESDPDINLSHSPSVDHVAYRLISVLPDQRCHRGEYVFRLLQHRSNGSLRAHALPGGTVLIGEDLLRLVNEAELAFIIGHEIGHIEAGSFDMAAIAILAKKDATLLHRLKAVTAAALSICEGGMDEIQADRFGVMLAEAAGYNPMAGVAALRKLPDPRKSRDYTLSDTHPPNELRETYVAIEARQRATRPQWPNPAYYGGKVDAQLAWDGAVAWDVVTRCMSPASPDSATLCGSPNHAPSHVSEQGWEQYSCKRAPTRTKSRCLVYSEYAGNPAQGCPGTLMCCP
jgi:hypothetical protein